MRVLFIVLWCSALGLMVSGCSVAGVATGLGASAGMAAAQEGGISRAWSDAKIQTQINDAWFNYDLEAFRKLDMTVNQGRVLLTGVVQNPEHRVEAVRLSWQPEGVTQVINEIRVAESTGIVGYARDAWISGRLRTAITFDKDVQSVNYNIDTVQGTVYLMGVAQSRAELNRVIETARTINDVRQVVSYVKIAGQEKARSVPVRSEVPYEDPPSHERSNTNQNYSTQPNGYQEPIIPENPPPLNKADSAPIQLEPVQAEPL